MDTLLWRGLSALARKIGLPTLLKLLLCLGVAEAAAYGISSVLKDITPIMLTPYMIAAALVVWLLHSLRCSGWLALLLLPLSGVVTLLVSVGRLGRPVLAVLQAVFQTRLVEIQDLGWRLDLSAALTATRLLGQDFQGLVSRLGAWLNSLAAPQAAFDPLAATFTWCLVAWLMVTWMGWWVLHHQLILLGLGPLVGLHAWVLYYTNARVITLVVALAIGLLLIILSQHFDFTWRWQSTSLDVPDNLISIGLVTIIVVAGLSLSAMGISSFSLARLERYLRELISPPQPANAGFSKSLGEALGLQVQASPESLFRRAELPTLPSQHLLTGGPELSKTVVMWVSLEGYPAMPQAEAAYAPGPPHYYWRSLAYNRYSGAGWFSDKTTTVSYAGGKLLVGQPEELVSTGNLNYRIVRQQVRIFRPRGGELYYTGELLTVDQDYEVAWRMQADPGDALGTLVASDRYLAVSRRLQVSPGLLRQAGSVYPGWVLESYLSLPDKLPQRVRDLALDLTATEPTPFDRAQAIELYLRNTYSYTLDIPLPPMDRDLVDYFLFDLKRGYCDYYASAMAVLARAAGLPARLVTGYAGGLWEPEEGRIAVTAADGHSWVEVYFPGYGWIEFEPTSNRELPDRRDLAAPEQPIVPEMLEVPLQVNLWERLDQFRQAVQRNLVWIVLAAWLGTNFYFWLDGWMLRLRKPQTTVSLVYRRLYRQAAHLQVKPEPGGTLHEYSQRLEQLLDRLARSGPWQYDLTRLEDDVRWLSEIYEQVLFSPRPLEKADQWRCVKTWQRMRSRFWLARLRNLKSESS